MSSIAKQNGTSLTKTNAKSAPRSNIPVAEALRTLANAARECIKYEDVIANAIKNADNMACLENQNNDLRRELGKIGEIADKNLDTYTTKTAEMNKEQQALQDDNRSANEKLKALESENKQLKDDKMRREEDLKLVKADLDQQSCDIANNQKILKQREKEIRELQSVHQEAEKRLSQLTEKHNQASDEIAKLKSHLHTAQQEVKGWEGLTSGLKGDELMAISARIKDFFWDCHNLMEHYFCRDLPSGFSENERDVALLRIVNSWPLLKDVTFVPRLNAGAAKRFRMAIAFAILANNLMEHIFQSTYVSRDHILYRLLVDQANTDSRRESCCRALLLSLRTENDGPREFLQSTEHQLVSLLSPNEHETFAQALRKLAAKAVMLWQSVQHQKTRIQATLSGPDFDQWNTLQLNMTSQEPVGALSLREPDATDTAAFALFPQFFTVTDTSNDYVLCKGCAVSKVQKAAVENDLQVSPSTLKRTQSASKRIRTMLGGKDQTPFLEHSRGA